MTKRISTAAALLVAAVVAFTVYTTVFADASTIDLEGYALGTVNAQDGWSSLGAAGSGCAVYDVAVSSSFGVPGFGSQSLRISNAVTSGCFGDQTFSKSLTDEAGETSAENGGLSGGTRQNHFEAQFDVRAMQLSEQPGLAVTMSPDRGDGARMSWVQVADMPDGLAVNFYDYVVGNAVDTGPCACPPFNHTVVASGLSRAETHTIKVTMDFVDGTENDVVNVYVDGVLMHTGTSWEDYFRDEEANPTRTVDSLLFRVSGTAAPATAGLGFLFDNVSLSSSTVSPGPVTVTVGKYIDGVHATDVIAGSASFPINASWSNTGFGDASGSFALSPVGFNNPNPYEATTAEMTVGANYSLSEDTTGSTVGADCSAGKPFALVGYTAGDTEGAAAGASPSLTAPDFTNMQTSKFAIVWNHKCGATLTLEKAVDNTGGGTALDTDWTLSASGPSPVSGVEGNASVTSAVVTPGTYDLSESGGPSSYTSSAWVCTGGTQDDGDTITLADGESVTCVITNTFVPPTPPPPTNACATPTVAPLGYTLQSGTNASDNVTIAPFTMFVGKGGNDIVKGPADGNYIVCTGSGSDIITLGNGGFTISAGTGNNNITTGDGDGYITSGSASDHITTGDGVQTIEADGGNNIITTGNGDKTITTGTANDNITTGSGNDTIDASGGTNNVKSGAGDDTITTGSASDTIDGGLGTDTCNADGGSNSLSNCEL